MVTGSWICKYKTCSLCLWAYHQPHPHWTMKNWLKSSDHNFHSLGCKSNTPGRVGRGRVRCHHSRINCKFEHSEFPCLLILVYVKVSSLFYLCLYSAGFYWIASMRLSRMKGSLKRFVWRASVSGLLHFTVNLYQHLHTGETTIFGLWVWRPKESREVSVAGMYTLHQISEIIDVLFHVIHLSFFR